MRIDRVRVGLTNTYLIRDRGAVLVDPGEPGRAETVVGRLTARTGPLPRISLIVVTHGHPDHTGSVPELARLTGAPVAIHERDAGWMTRGALVVPDGLTAWGRVLAGIGRRLLPRLVSVQPFTPEIVIPDEGLSLAPYGVSGRLLHTPGHTPGSLTLLLQTGDALVGDLAMNALPFCLRPTLAVMGDDQAALEASWDRIGRAGARVVHPGHGPSFPFDAVRPS